jgi:hypothetical protein
MQHKCESRESNQEEGGEQMKTHRITPAYIHYREAPTILDREGLFLHSD